MKIPRGPLAWLLLSVFTGVCIGSVVAVPPGVYDEGLIVSGAERILEGQRPYVDFYSGYPPGQFYTIALVFRLFGRSLAVERIWDSLWRLAIVAAAVWLAREVNGKNVRLLAFFCAAALCGALSFRLYPMVAATLPFLCALACALTFLRTANPRWIFGAGLLLSVTALYRHDLAACAGVVIFWSVRRNRRAIGLLGAGILVVAVPAVVYVLREIPWQYLQQAFLEFPRVNAAARHLPLFASRFQFVEDVLLPAAVACFAAFAALRTPADRRTPLVVLTASVVLTTLLGTQRLDTAHCFPSLVTCLVVLAGLAPCNLPRRLLWTVTVLFFGLIPAVRWASQVRMIRHWPPSDIARAGFVRISPDQSQAVRFVDARVPPRQQLFVGTTTHSRIFLNDALFAFLANRPQITRYDMWLPGVMNTPLVQSDIVRQLDANLVPCVVLFEAPLSNEPNTSSVDSGVKILDDYLNRRYREVAVFGSYHILQRASS